MKILTKFYALSKELIEYSAVSKSKESDLKVDAFKYKELLLLGFSNGKYQLMPINLLNSIEEIFECERLPDVDFFVWNQPETEQKEDDLFRVGDRVFAYFDKWGTVEKVTYSLSEGQTQEILVKFDNGNSVSFPLNSPFLSFTEYNFTTGGFSHIRPKPEPKVGDIGFAWDDESDLKRKCCAYGRLIIIDDKDHNKYNLDGMWYPNFSTEKPF